MEKSVVSWYDANANRLIPVYEAIPATATRDWLADFLPIPSGLVVDIGAGTSRAAGAFAARG